MSEQIKDDELVPVWSIHSKAQFRMVIMFKRLHLIKVVEAVKMIDPLIPDPDRSFGFYMTIEGPKPVLWILDKVGDLLLKFDKQGQMRKEQWDQSCRRRNVWSE